MVSGLAAIISRIQTGHDKMISVLENHATKIENAASPDTFRTSLGSILNEARSVKDELSVFKLAADSGETEYKFNPKDYAN